MSMERKNTRIHPFAAVPSAAPVGNPRPEPSAIRPERKPDLAPGHTGELAQTLPQLLPRLWRFSLRLTGDRHDAEDLVQRTCVRALERQHQLQPSTSTLSWLYSIAHSVWLNEVRARRIRRRGCIQWSDELAETVADGSVCTPDNSVLYQQIVSAVARLPNAQRAVLLLVAVEGMSYRETASALEVPIGTVMSRLARARLTIGKAFGVRPGATQRNSSRE
jgi:RNA polymerase sigma-70 factor, ECF subfamily